MLDISMKVVSLAWWEVLPQDLNAFHRSCTDIDNEVMDLQ